MKSQIRMKNEKTFGISDRIRNILENSGNLFENALKFKKLTKTTENY